MTKKQERQLVYDKFGGKCAYCGCELNGKFQVDHIQAHWHNWSDEDIVKHKMIRGVDSIENMNPACVRCNKWKATFNIEQFRIEIQEQIKRLNAYSSNYRMAKDYGLLAETIKPVVFYFELYAPTGKEAHSKAVEFINEL